jgi:hypothetical protein
MRGKDNLHGQEESVEQHNVTLFLSVTLMTGLKRGNTNTWMKGKNASGPKAILSL